MQKQGRISRIIFHNESNGYTVAVFDTEEGAIRIAGSFNAPKPGKEYVLEGKFVIHPKYGEQFSFGSYEECRPKGKEAILEFLSSGTISGIGPKTAELIVETYGEDALDVMESDPDRLLEIRGIGPKNLEKIKASYAESREFARVALELQEMGIEMSHAIKIFKLYGAESKNVVTENPYTLIDDIRGISFIKADAIAQKIGIDADSDFRIESGIKYVLRTWAVNGSTLMPEELLIEKVIELLDSNTEIIRESLTRMAFCGELQTDVQDGMPVVYLYGYYNAEQRTAYNLRRLKEETYIPIPADLDKLIADAEASLSSEGSLVKLSEKQRAAVRAALFNNVTIITGGPGTGKTTIINVIVKIFERLDISTALAAPTGRAAKRMEEAAGVPAMTIHRMLEYVFSEIDESMHFGRNAENKLEQMAIIIDEASMIDIMLMDGLLEAIRSGARLIITGDADQLPSVGAGNVLRDIIKSEYIHTVRLREIFRQAQDSYIVTNAHRINEGEYPEIGEGSADKDFYIMHQESEEEILESIKAMVETRLASHFDFIDGAADIQVLTPTKKGILGAPNLNTVLQEVINPADAFKAELKLGGRIFREGDKVMQLRNNYLAEWKDAASFMTGKGIFNGDMGVVESIDEDDRSMLVRMDDKLVRYEGEMLEEIDLSYAITVHKSQGSEFTAVIIPMWAFPPMLMTRNLLYTAITRGKKLVVICGSERRLQWMINNNRTDERYTGLCHKIEDIGV